MTTPNKRTDFIVPEILVDKITTGFSDGVEVMYGSPAVVTSPTLPGDKRGGDTVKVPYLGNIGEFEDVAEGDALTPVVVSSTSETGTVSRSGKAVEITKWAELAALYADPYAALTDQMKAGFTRRAGKALVTAAMASLPGSMVLDATGQLLSHDLVIDATSLWGDEIDEDPALMFVHSKGLKDLRKLKDSSGRPLVIDPNTGVANGGMKSIRTFCGIPLVVTDRLAPAGSVYSSLIVKKGALALWWNATPEVDTDKDILKHTELAAINIYYVAYRYKNMPGLTKGGVVQLKHAVSG